MASGLKSFNSIVCLHVGDEYTGIFKVLSNVQCRFICVNVCVNGPWRGRGISVGWRGKEIEPFSGWLDNDPEKRSHVKSYSVTSALLTF